MAITFTEAAAAEMAQRVGQALAALAEGEPAVGLERELLAVADDRELRLRCAALADEVHRLPASTFHSWCHRQLRRFPLEAGLHPNFEVDADGTLVEAAAAEVVEEALRGLAADPLADDWKLLAAAAVVPPRIAEALRRLAESGLGPEALERDPCAADVVAPVLGRLREGLAAFRDAEQGRLAAVIEKPDRGGDQRGAGSAARAARRRCGRRPRWWPSCPASIPAYSSAVASGRARSSRPPSRPPWERRSPRSPPRPHVVSGILDGLAALRELELGAARRVLAELLGRLRERLRGSGIVSYADLLVSAERLLASTARVRAEIRRDIDQLMVDEFQDTDDTQCRIVRWLALDGARGRRPGLFIVGDPKQSIYGWRRADLAAYDAFKTTVADEGGLIRPLVRNFRSVRPILDEVERVVERVMLEETGVQPRFQALEATDGRRTELGFATRFLVGGRALAGVAVRPLDRRDRRRGTWRRRQPPRGDEASPRTSGASTTRPR